MPQLRVSVCLCFLLWMPLACSSPRAPTGTALYGVTVLDGTGSAPRPDQVLVLEGERIRAILPVSDFRQDSVSEVLDLQGSFVIPGLIDLHVHFPESPTAQAAILERLLQFGITTILNPGAQPAAGIELRQRIESGEVSGPRLFTCGRTINYLPAGETASSWAAEVRTEAEIRQEIQDQAAAGVDCIKLYKRVPPELVQAAIDQAHALQLLVVGHMGATTWSEATRSGIDMLVHSGWGTSIDELVDLPDPSGATNAEWYPAYAAAPQRQLLPALAAELVEHDVIVVSTLSITMASSLGRDASWLPRFRTDLAPDADLPDWWGENWRVRHPQYDPDSEEEAELLETVFWPGVLDIQRAYYQHGVRFGVGTDVGNAWITPGFSYHHEIQLYQEAGIPPLDILKMATHNGAEALGILDDVGTLEVGKRADLLVLGSDPSRDIEATLDIEAVYMGGQRLDLPSIPQQAKSPGATPRG